MSGRDKSGRRDGTDPTTAGSTPEAEAKPGSGDPQQQQRDMTDRTNEPHGRDSATGERWFNRQLNQLYSEVISEPLPREFLELIDKLREKTPK